MSATPAAAGAGSPSVLRMAAPLVVSFWMRSAFTFVDTIYASTLGDDAVAAIGLSFPFELLMIAVWVGLSTGLTSNLSRAMGAREDRKVAQHLRLSTRLVWCIAPVFVLIGAALWWLAPRLAPDAEVARQFAIFGPVLVGGSGLTLFWSVIPDSIVKAHGDTRSTMWAGIWSNVVNLGLNTVFVFGFGWGILGIALSTVLGRFAGLAYALRKAAAHEARRKATGGPWVSGVDPSPYRSTLGLAVPAAVAYTLMATETMIINGLLAMSEDGQESIAAYAIFFRVFQFVVMPAIATAVAMLPYAARRFGEGDLGGLRRGLREAHLAGLAYVAAAFPVMWLAAPPLARALAHSPITEQYAAFALRLVPLAALAAMPVFLCRPVFEGMGRGRPGLVMAVLRYVVLAAPGAWGGLVLAQRFGMPGMYGLLVGLVAAAAVTSVVFLEWVRRALGAEARRAAATAGEAPA